MFGVLHLKSAYSMLKSTIPMDVLVEQAKASGYDFVAVSDDELHGMLHLFEHAKKHHIKPILGIHIKVQYAFGDSGFLVYVRDQEGYRNLLQIILLKQDKALTLEDIILYQKGLIFVTSGKDSLLTSYLLDERIDQASHMIQITKTSLDHFYLGLSLDTFDLEMKVAPHMYHLSEHHHIPLLPIHHTAYLSQEDKEVYEALIKIDSDQNEIAQDEDYHFMTKEELIARFMDYPYVFDTLEKVIQSITYTFQKPHFDMPIFKVPSGTPELYLKSLAQVGLKKRLKKGRYATIESYQKRLAFELDVIHNMGFDHYFLIVYDFVKYAKTHDILVGPGRGSSAGSLVAYAIGITDVDPLQYDLLFERFLNPERITMPDIDMDFPDNKRDEVIQYVKEKYGSHHMISIITFGTFALRSSIRDIARVMKIDTTRVNGIIQNVIDEKVDETDEETMRLLRVAKKIEGLPRHTGTHAAGVILCEQDLSKHIPLQKGLFDGYQSQFEASDLESLGLLKIDFLGIRNLQVIDDVVKEIQKKDVNFQLNNIPFDNQKTYELLSESQTTGVFQLESLGMRAVLRKLKPSHFEDIIALLALFRPGPMAFIDLYIERRNGAAFDYIHKDLEPILKNTYGIIVYQEQIMRIAHEFAGYSLAEADLLRRAISKKSREILEQEESRFIKKCEAQGYPSEIGKEIYDLIVKFADYGFNRSHSVAYAIVAYQMAYLKANYFSVFMTILLTSVIGNEGLTKDYILELKKQKVKVLPPHIHLSTDIYQIKDEGIYMPFQSIKSFGKLTVQKMIEVRNESPFTDYNDLKLKLKKIINDRNLEMLIHAGSLNAFNLTHQTMIQNIELDDAGYEQYITDFKMKTFEEYSFLELAEKEKEALGFNLTYQPMAAFESYIKEKALDTFEALSNKDKISVLAYIKKSKKIKTKNNEPMAFLLLDDGAEELEVTLFPKTFARYEHILNQDVLLFTIKKNHYNGQTSNVCDMIKDIKAK